jgi:mercuric ion binding protein
MRIPTHFTAVVLALSLAGAVRAAELTAKLTDVHLCCKGCTSTLEKAVGKVKGAKAVASTSTKEGETLGTVTVTADSKENLQKAIDAIAAAGFHGKIDNKDVKFKMVSLDKEARGKNKVQKLELAGIHNCCPACAKAIKTAVEKVDGVKSDTVEPKKDKFTVEGDFVARDVLKALNKAGFHCVTQKEKDAKDKEAKASESKSSESESK